MEVSATLSVFKLSGAIYQPRSSTPSVRSFYLCPFHWKLRQSGVSLESPGLEIIPEVPGNRAKVAQIHDARKELSTTLSVLKWTGAIFRPRSSTPIVRSFYLSPFCWKLRPSGDNLQSPVLQKYPKILANRAKVPENNHVCEAVSSTLLVLKSSGAIFRPRSSTPSMRYFYLFPSYWKLRPSEVSLASPGLENIPQVQGNRDEVDQNHDARKVVSATLSVLKWSRAIFLPRSLKVNVQKIFLCLFHCETRPSEVSLESQGLENIP